MVVRGGGGGGVGALGEGECARCVGVVNRVGDVVVVRVRECEGSGGGDGVMVLFKFYKIDEVVIADKFDKGLFPDNTLNGKRILYIENAATRTWLINEFSSGRFYIFLGARSKSQDCSVLALDHHHLSRLVDHFETARHREAETQIRMVKDITFHETLARIFTDHQAFNGI